jgi:hypothetical protein
MSAQLTFERSPATTAGPAAPVRHGWLQRAWLRILRTVREMNYANRRLAEVQAPWTVDLQWHRR